MGSRVDDQGYVGEGEREAKAIIPIPIIRGIKKKVTLRGKLRSVTFF